MGTSDLAARLARTLARAGATMAFGVPGGGANLDVVGALLNEGVDFVLAHAESSAAIMASTHGLLTRSPAPVIVTRGPGATSVVNGSAQATLDRYPLVVISDTVPFAQRTRVAHQRLDQRALFAPITNGSATITSNTSDDELVGLVEVATRWPFGAVHLDYDEAAEAAPTQATIAPFLNHDPEAQQLDTPRIAEAAELVAQAARPVVIAGMEAAINAELIQVLTTFGAPVLTTYQATGLVDTEGPINAGLFTNGEPERRLLDAADLIITLGLDLVEPIPQPWSYTTPVLRLSSTVQEDDYLPATLDLVAPLVEAAGRILHASHGWHGNEAASQRSHARDQIHRAESSDTFGPVQLVESAAALIPRNVTTTVDAGAHFLAIMPLWPVAEPFRLLISNGLATMGFAVPAAIGAALARPNEPVLALTGDGGLSMTMAELETIARRQLPVTVVVFNDAALSLIRIKQTPAHGGDTAVAYHQTDFAEIARASGIDGYVVNSASELRSCLDDGWDRPRLIDARIDPSSYAALLAATRG